MKYRVGAKVRVVDCYSGGNFEVGDIVTVAQIGFEDGENCYGAISPYDKMMWFLYEDEVTAATNADRIRVMSDEEPAKLLLDGCRGSRCEERPQNKFGSVDCFKCRMDWLQQPAKEDT